MTSALDNIFWNCLSGPQAHFATGAGDIRRYAPGFSPILGCRVPQVPDFDELANHSAPGDSFYIDIWDGAPPSGWRIDKEARMFKMVWRGAAPTADGAPDAVALRTEHHAQALELAQLTNPGPFGVRTPELGEYFGYFEGDQLIAMAGERTCVDDLHEISGICTHPEHQGKGLARKLTLKLVHRQLARGKLPFLHVMSHNPARALYEKLGFRNYLETCVRVVTRI